MSLVVGRAIGGDYYCLCQNMGVAKPLFEPHRLREASLAFSLEFDNKYGRY